MKCLHLPILRSSTVIEAARRPSFTCVQRCHMRSPKKKGQNPINSNSVAGAYIQACCFANPNIQWFLMPGQLPTPVLIKRIYIIFLWTELSKRYPIPIVNLLLKTVCVFGVLWGAHSYPASPKYNNITNYFRNRLPLLVLNT